MARSKRKTAIRGVTTAESEAADKAAWHRRWRRGEKQRLNADPDSDPVGHLGYSNKWLMEKDGKRYFHDPPEFVMRK